MTTQVTTENLTIHLKVKDYSAFRVGYDKQKNSFLSAGLTNGRVFRGAEDQNELVILQDVADPTKARAWLDSADLRTAMQSSGVIGAPSIRFAAPTP